MSRCQVIDYSRIYSSVYCTIVAVSRHLIRVHTWVAAPCCRYDWRTARQTILWRYTTQTDYRLIAICTTAGRSCSVTLEPGQLSLPWTLPIVFVFNQSNVVVNMQSLPLWNCWTATDFRAYSVTTSSKCGH